MAKRLHVFRERILAARSGVALAVNEALVLHHRQVEPYR
jgi:hypothetical protein